MKFFKLCRFNIIRLDNPINFYIFTIIWLTELVLDETLLESWLMALMLFLFALLLLLFRLLFTFATRLSSRIFLQNIF